MNYQDRLIEIGFTQSSGLDSKYIKKIKDNKYRMYTIYKIVVNVSASGNVEVKAKVAVPVFNNLAPFDKFNIMKELLQYRNLTIFNLTVDDMDYIIPKLEILEDIDLSKYMDIPTSDEVSNVIENNKYGYITYDIDNLHDVATAFNNIALEKLLQYIHELREARCYGYDDLINNVNNTLKPTYLESKTSRDAILLLVKAIGEIEEEK